MKTKELVIYVLTYITTVLLITLCLSSCSANKQYFVTETTTVVKYRVVDPDTGTIFKGRQKLTTIENKHPQEDTETDTIKVTTGF